MLLLINNFNLLLHAERGRLKPLIFGFNRVRNSSNFVLEHELGDLGEPVGLALRYHSDTLRPRRHHEATDGKCFC